VREQHSWKTNRTHTVSWTLNSAVSSGEFRVSLVSKSGTAYIRKQVLPVAGKSTLHGDAVEVRRRPVRAVAVLDAVAVLPSIGLQNVLPQRPLANRCHTLVETHLGYEAELLAGLRPRVGSH
jgi:hypothetical protein